MAFNDAHCPRCGQKIRWMGAIKDRPPCHHCKHQISSQELEETERKLDEARKKAMDGFDEE